MSEAPLSVLLVDVDPALHGALAAAGLVLASAADVSAARDHDAVLLQAPTVQALAALRDRADLPRAAYDSAVVVLAPVADDAMEAELLGLGVEALVPAAEMLPRAIRHAVLRKRAERAARTAYATDLATGLPHQAQLLEHMAQLLALREREPAPMVLLVLRIDGYAAAAARLGAESANVLRRKIAVRLRSGVRAGDVVAALGADGFGVLLGHLEAKSDGERVAAKLVRALQQPVVVAGQPCPVTCAVGLSLYPEHGKEAHGLLRRASAQAGSVATMGRGGLAGLVERGPDGAANDPAA
jgi:diguanylate cyclase (GGDEF)-like protein